MTANIYMDFGRLYLKMNNKEEALINFEAAFLIYQNRNLIPSAHAAFQIATILEEHRRLNDSLHYAGISFEIYTN